MLEKLLRRFEREAGCSAVAMPHLYPERRAAYDLIQRLSSDVRTPIGPNGPADRGREPVKGFFIFLDAGQVRLNVFRRRGTIISFPPDPPPGWP